MIEAMPETHSAMMKRCIDLAQKAAGRTAPNPLVGCVITQGSEIVGEGFHPKAGEPHAEVFALRAAGDRAKNATAYVSLEPCSHFGRTPPCANALIEAGVAKVVVGMVDPDERVSGSGISRLKEAGIEVIVGVEEEACKAINEAFIHRVVHKKPLGILKFAMTLDGKLPPPQVTVLGFQTPRPEPKSMSYAPCVMRSLLAPTPLIETILV